MHQNKTVKMNHAIHSNTLRLLEDKYLAVFKQTRNDPRLPKILHVKMLLLI